MLKLKNNIMKIEDYLNYVCGIADRNIKSNKNKNTQVIDGIGEVEINGVTYQAQILLEPNTNNWVQDDVPTIRMVEN